MLLTLALHSNAFAINREPRPKLCNTIFSADAVVHVKVIKHEKVLHPDDPEGAPDDKYQLRILQQYRGDALSTLTVLSEMGVLNVSLDVGKEYVLFPNKGSDGVWSIFDDQGEGAGGLIYSSVLESKIRDILGRKTASIEGEVRDKNWKLKQGVTLHILGGGHSYTVTTDKDGRFFLAVPPNTYQIVTPETTVVTVYSPDGQHPDPKNLTVQPKSLAAGQCMQIQLQQR